MLEGKTIGLIGAGGKMGCRIADNLRRTLLRCHYVEVSPGGIANLRARQLAVTPLAQAAAESDVVILAVPDVSIADVSREVVSGMKTGALLLTLDPAAPLAGQVA